jgi:hypothetical protein
MRQVMNQRIAGQLVQGGGQLAGDPEIHGERHPLRVRHHLSGLPEQARVLLRRHGAG